jgi:predicted dinucleotide-binding enzyme
MDIGIIGAGNIGSALAQRLVALGHQVRVANSRGPHSLQAMAEAHGITPATVAEAAHARDVVIVTIPLRAVADLPAGLFKDAPAAAVVDTNNYYPDLRDGRIAAIDDGLPESVWVARQLARPVLKMFNTIHAPTLLKGGLPAGAANRICLPVAGDDAAAKQMMIGLADAMGFDGLDAGPLAESWRQQPGTPVYCRDLPLAAARAALAEAQHDLVAEYRRQTLDRARRMAAAAQHPGAL